MSCLAPSPIAIIAITAATPMMMPSAVKKLRSLLRRSAMRAIRSVESGFMLTSGSQPEPRVRVGRRLGGRRRLVAADRLDHELVALVDVPVEDLGHGAVGQPDRDADRLGLQPAQDPQGLLVLREVPAPRLIPRGEAVRA